MLRRVRNCWHYYYYYCYYYYYYDNDDNGKRNTVFSHGFLKHSQSQYNRELHSRGIDLSFSRWSPAKKYHQQNTSNTTRSQDGKQLSSGLGCDNFLTSKQEIDDKISKQQANKTDTATNT